MKKRSLTLLEVLIATVLLGFLLTALFSLLYQSLKKQTESFVLKQQTLQIALFDQSLKQILNKTKKLWTAPHPGASQEALFVQLPASIDPEWEITKETIEETLYLNEKKQLCLMTSGSKQQQRISVLFDQIDRVSYRFFHPKQMAWQELWPATMPPLPNMLEITLHQGKSTTSFAFFPDAAQAPIPYGGKS